MKSIELTEVPEPQAAESRCGMVVLIPAILVQVRQGDGEGGKAVVLERKAGRTKQLGRCAKWFGNRRRDIIQFQLNSLNGAKSFLNARS
jgi:hypothetical protein